MVEENILFMIFRFSCVYKTPLKTCLAARTTPSISESEIPYTTQTPSPFPLPKRAGRLAPATPILQAYLGDSSTRGA